MRSIRLAITAAALLAAALSAAPALADGLVTRAAALPAAERASLQKEIADYRASHPEAFEAVRGVTGHRPEGYQGRQNPVPEVSRELRGLGAGVLLPMLDALAFEAPERGGATDAEWSALVSGMLDAVGVLRDGRSGPVLRAAFEAGPSDARVARAAAEAIGRLCGQADLSTLIKHTARGDALKLAAIHGLGECRRVESAKHLASVLAAATDDETAEAAASALGVVGSSWAWEAAGPSAAAKGAEVRAIAAEALVGGFVRHGGEVRRRMQKSIQMVQHPGTADLIVRARTAADDETRAALDRLGRDFDRARRR